MATNPMQKKARNSFILGVFVALIIFIVLGAAGYFLIGSRNKIKADKEGTLTYAYRLKNSIDSGKTIEASDVEEIVVTSKVVPEGAFPSRVQNSKGQWESRNFPSGYKAKIKLAAGTIITSSMMYQGDELTSDVRYVEYNMLTLGTTVREGNFVDIRVTFPNGQDLIVVAKKEIKAINGATVGFEMSEDEIALMRSAIVEAYIMKASNIYVAKYIAAGEQSEAIKTYVPTSAVQDLIRNNPNIESEARSALESRFDEGIRRYIDDNRNSYAVEEKENLEAGIQKEIQDAKAAREAYLTGLTSAN